MASPSDPSSSTYADLRSGSGDEKRHQKEKRKYYGFRSGSMSRVGQLFQSFPASLLAHPFGAAADPILSHPQDMRVRMWTKRDQFDERTLDIWPLDRKDHKRGRAHRGCGCRYTPPRWEYERSMKGKRGLMDWHPEELEDVDSIYEFGINDDDEGSIFGEAEVEVEDEKQLDDNAAAAVATNDEREVDYDFLSDVDSEGDTRSDLDDRESVDDWWLVG